MLNPSPRLVYGRNNRSNAISVLILLLTGSLSAQQAGQQALLGFTAQSAKAESDWEDRFRALPDPQIMRSNMQLLSAHPHHVGSPYDKQNAEWILAQYKQWGWDAHIESFQVLFPTPKSRLLEMVAPTRFTAKLDEPALSIDPTSKQKNEQLPTYNAYSPDGDVTAPLVYVNYGVIEDYEELALHGVSVKGAIVIARYGHSWRGIKPKLAAEHGAVGCIIYSDPGDDGYGPETVFPKGPMRPAEGVQRGSVLDAPQYPGDPLTPNIGATANAKRLKREDATSLTRIPVLPVSYADAQPLLAAMDGPVAPAGWRGGMPITYRLGPGPAKVHLKLAFNWDLKPVYDVVATMRGATEPDIWILRANHHDAWVNGAGDPVSGQVALLEEARALGQLSKEGWKPKRSIMYFSWDGEEPMLLGSTEYAEEHADDLRQHAAVYVNSDGNQRGYLSAAGSHSLESLVNEVARKIEDPETKVSAWKRLQARLVVEGSPQERKQARSRPNLRIGALGSGSDYSPFLDHLGIASLDLSYGGEDNSAGVYHSIYDDFYWYTHFSDADFAYGRALAQTAGTLVMRLADADILPYDFSPLSDTVHQYSDEVKALLKAHQDEAAERQSDIESDVYRITSDPKHPTVAPPALDTPPYLNFAPLDNALALLDKAAAHYNAGRAKAEAGSVSGDQLKTVNEQLAKAERKLTSPQGLPRRPWMRHLLYAPGWYTGYDPKTLPGVREAIEERRYAQADAQIALVAQALTDEAAYIEQLAKELR
jgi:N-acetylated-alpha-linked acidic dipeptidase